MARHFLSILVVLALAASASAVSRARHDFSKSSESALNDHINTEYSASYQYQALWAYFSRDDVALLNVAKYFKAMSVEESEHAHQFQEYMHQRGGRVVLQDITPPEHEFSETAEKSDLLVAFERALGLEKSVYQNLLQLHALADSNKDAQFQDHIEAYLAEQVESIKTLANFVAQLTRIGKDGTGVIVFDREFES